MRFPFQKLPGRSDDLLRPVLDVHLGGDAINAYRCLLDTGAAHNRFASWAAEISEIDLIDGERTSLALGGLLTNGITVPVSIEVGGTTWEAPVTFCDPWPFQFHLLGQEGFFRFFTVTIKASTFEIEIEPDLGSDHS